MGCTTRIRLVFTKEKHARWAMHVTEEMIKLIFAMESPEEYPWVQEADSLPSLSRQYLQYRQLAGAIKFQTGHSMLYTTALDWLKRNRTEVVIERCADIQRSTGFESDYDFFPQLCLACILRFPQVPFRAYFRHEMTVSGAVQLLRVNYDGTAAHVQEKNGEWPFDESDWGSVPVRDYRVADGAFVRQEEDDRQASPSEKPPHKAGFFILKKYWTKRNK